MFIFGAYFVLNFMKLSAGNGFCFNLQLTEIARVLRSNKILLKQPQASAVWSSGSSENN